MVENDAIFTRKNEHLRINLEEDVRSGVKTGLDDYSLEYCALPELSLDSVSTKTEFLKHAVNLPLFISSMTGGTKEGEIVNIHLAEAAQQIGIAMGLGSQRAALEDRSIASSFNLRKYAPSVLIFSNLGAVQLNYGVGIDECRRVVEIAQADGLILHLNPLQEALQPEGNTNFFGLLDKIGQICQLLERPVIVKEVGWGISDRLALQLRNVGVSAIDVAGAGGTSWSQVEMHRMSDEKRTRIASHFRDWGLPTAAVLRKVSALNLGIPLIASGGIQNGVDIAKCIALGADQCGMAGRLLKTAVISTEKVVELIEEIELELKIAMFACGVDRIQKLKIVHIKKKQEILNE